MEFEGDYRLDEYLANGGGKSVDDLRNFITKSLKKGTWTCPKIKTMTDLKITLGDFGCGSIAAINTAIICTDEMSQKWNVNIILLYVLCTFHKLCQ